MRRLLLLLVLAVAAGSFLAFRPATTTDAGDLDGAWKMVTYTTSDGEEFEVNGVVLLLYTAGHYATIWAPGAPREALPEEPTDEQLLAAWRRFIAHAGTYEVDGNVVRWKVLVGKNPNAMAAQVELSFTFEVDGNTMTRTVGDGRVFGYTRIE